MRTSCNFALRSKGSTFVNPPSPFLRISGGMAQRENVSQPLLHAMSHEGSVASKHLHCCDIWHSAPRWRREGDANMCWRHRWKQDYFTFLLSSHSAIGVGQAGKITESLTCREEMHLSQQMSCLSSCVVNPMKGWASADSDIPIHFLLCLCKLASWLIKRFRHFDSNYSSCR